VKPSFGQYGLSRHFEILPGLLTWTILLGSVVASIFAPLAAIIFIIIFDLFWSLRVLYFIIHVLSSYSSYKASLATDWAAKFTALPGHDDLYQVVMLPTYKEELSIIDEAFQALLRAKYNPQRLIVVLGGEERDIVNFRHLAEQMRSKYQNHFAALVCSVHARDIPGEIPGKGSNMRAMGLEVKRVIDALKIPYQNIVVNAFDVDTIAHPQYFAALGYQFLTVPNPLRSSYQPVTVFSNNIWTAPAPVRISAFGTTFWLLSELTRPERMWTFSSHSMPWQMLVDVGFWEPDIVSEDSRIFMQAFLHYNGEYRVTPIHLPVSMDTVASGSYKESLKDLYKQQRRWAWGVEHIPYMLREFPKHPTLARGAKFKYIFNHFEGMLTWSCAPIIIFILGYLPFSTVGEASPALIVNAPYVLEWLMRISTIGLFVTCGLSLLLLPPRPATIPRTNWGIMLLQWGLLPVSTVIFGSIPAIDAQTRLMFGRYLGFNVTKKVAASRTSSL
jgi:hypothetical protein